MVTVLDGSELPVEVSLSHLALDGADHVLLTVSDITERSLSEALLRAMTDNLQSLAAFSVTESSLVDRVFPNGQKVAFFHKTAVKAQRPDKLRAEATGDDVSGTWLVNGPEMQVYDARTKTYVSLDVPPRLEQALDALFE